MKSYQNQSEEKEKAKKNPTVWICCFCQAELKLQLGCEIRSFWDGEAPGIERRRGARQENNEEGLWWGHGGCAREMLLFQAQIGQKVNK